MHLFVTGGTGFFGKALLRHWSAGSTPELSGARFTLLSRNPEQFRALHGDLLDGIDVHLVKGDIQRPETLPYGDYTHVLHAATDSTKGLSLTPLQRFNQIVEGTRHVLDLALRSGKPRVLVTSSGGVYGNISQFEHGVPEDYHGMPDPMNPHNSYSVAKRLAEHMCALYHEAYGLETVIARCFTFVGEDLPLDAHFAIGNFLRDAIAGRDIVIQGDGTPVRSYLDQRDLAEWLTQILFKGKSQRVYNVGSNQKISIEELASKVVSLLPNKRKPKIITMNTIRKNQSDLRNYYIPDISRVENELILKVRYCLDDAIKNVIDKLK